MSSTTRRGGAELLDLVGSAASVSAANTGRMRYDVATQKFQASLNGGSFVDVTTGGSLAIGSTITSANGAAGQGYGAGGSGGTSLDAITASTGGPGTIGYLIIEEYTG